MIKIITKLSLAGQFLLFAVENVDRQLMLSVGGAEQFSGTGHLGQMDGSPWSRTSAA